MSEMPGIPSPENEHTKETETELAERARTTIGRIVMFHPDKHIDTSEGTPTPGHIAVDKVPIENGAAQASFWLPPEGHDGEDINHVIAQCPGAALWDAAGDHQTALYFVTPDSSIVDGDLARLSPTATESLVTRLRDIGRELGTPGIR